VSLPEFDLVVVGGRPAGASLGARLGTRGLRVLVVDRATFPSEPEVPSCPIMYPSAVALLDEIGFAESAYRHAATQIRTGVIGFEGYFRATLRMPSVQGRDYLYGFDRARFDAALWNHLGTIPNVTRRSGFGVTELLRDDHGAVVGIIGGEKGSPSEQIRARLGVVGADGRHSLVARKAGATVVEDRDEHTSTIHFAEWEHLAPATSTGEPVLQIVSTGRGGNALFFPSSEGRVHVAWQMRSDRAHTGGDAAAYYESHLRALPTVERRLAGAHQIGPLLGVKRIANRYRVHGGPGWVLVGDAVHHKDPLDGQGIRDALIESRALADLISEVHEGRLTWAAMLPRYREAIVDATREMFEATMERLARDLYTDIPPLIIRTLARWSLTDPEYQRRFLLFLARAVPPSGFRTRGLMAGVIARGLARDMRDLIKPKRADEAR
jgi:2-polyprenyl-6-methoxyphenol hydroxylase-like FAD-dependent oxidoreductase